MNIDARASGLGPVLRRPFELLGELRAAGFA